MCCACCISSMWVKRILDTITHTHTQNTQAHARTKNRLAEARTPPSSLPRHVIAIIWHHVHTEPKPSGSAEWKYYYSKNPFGVFMAVFPQCDQRTHASQPAQEHVDEMNTYNIRGHSFQSLEKLLRGLIKLLYLKHIFNTHSVVFCTPSSSPSVFGSLLSLAWMHTGNLESR